MTNDKLIRSISQSGTLGDSLSTSAIRDIIQARGAQIGIPSLNPHDLRRTFAKLSRLGGCPIETVQKSLGHASVRTTEIYLNTGEEANAGDYITF